MMLGLAACGVEASDPLFMSRFVDIPPGFECSYGGVSIETGFDTNNNGVLGVEAATVKRIHHDTHPETPGSMRSRKFSETFYNSKRT